MAKVIDFTGNYNAKANETVVRGNINFMTADDIKGHDKVVAFESMKDKFKDTEKVTFVKDK